MSKINIRGIKDNSNDSSYRYKMERMNLKIEGKKTVIANLSKVAGDIGRNEKTLLNYFGKSFGCTTTYEVKTGKAIVSKVVSLSDLEPKLFSYIETYVLCDTCKNPETSLEESKKGLSKLCKACGKSNFVK